MSTPAEVVALGEEALVCGFALVGARLVIAESPAAALAAWAKLDDAVGLVVLTPAAAAAVGSARFPTARRRTVPISVVLPDD